MQVLVAPPSSVPGSSMTRRRFIGNTIVLSTTAVGLAEAASRVFAAPAPGKIPVGLQLYAVRDEFARDVPGTLKKVAQLGYRGVEFWGYGGTPAVYQDYTAKQLRSMLDENKLQCCGIHLQLKALNEAELPVTIENNKILGNRFLIVAAAQKEMSSLAGIKELAGRLNAAHEKCQAHNMRVGYHAHGFDFIKHEGRFAWDHLFSQTRPEVIMQLDIANSLSGGGDPVAMLKKFPGRTLSLHIRETGEKTFSSDYYKEVFQLAETTGGIQWYVVEQGGDGGKGFEAPEHALKALRAIGK